MAVSKKIRVAVLYGGRSGEHEVSLQSAASVVKNLDSKRFEVVPVSIDKQGCWIVNDLAKMGVTPETKALPLKTANAFVSSTAGQLPVFQAENKNSSPLFDVVFPVMHGIFCEDGTIQGLLESMNYPYVGAGVLASGLGMDKDVSKRLVAAAGIKVPEFETVKLGQWQSNPQAILQAIKKRFAFPVFVKPANTGSSVGVHKVRSFEQLSEIIEDAFLYDTKILIEQALDVREIELSVLENPEFGKPAKVSLPGEVVPSHEFYSYEAKYLDEKGAELIIPAKLDKLQIKMAQSLAVKVFEILECEGMARVDLFLDKKTGEFVFNEINTLPGFTQISMYPKLWEATGITYSELLTYLIDLALARFERKQKLKHEWAITNS